MGEWTKELDGAVAIVNLTGKTVNCRYTQSNREEILDSRVDSTTVIGKAIAQCANPPPVWLNSSTATIYTHNFGEPWDESGATEATTEAKDEFSVAVAKAWEEAFFKAATPRTRKVALRSSLVLGLGKNSVFPVLRNLTRLGLGGAMGSGMQYVSWIHILDFCRAVEWLIEHEELKGPINVAAHNPVTNREMMRMGRNIFGVPFGLPASNWMLEVGAFFLRTETELMIKSRRVQPARLLKSGFKFRFKTMADAFTNLQDQEQR